MLKPRIPVPPPRAGVGVVPGAAVEVGERAAPDGAVTAVEACPATDPVGVAAGGVGVAASGRASSSTPTMPSASTPIKPAPISIQTHDERRFTLRGRARGVRVAATNARPNSPADG